MEPIYQVTIQAVENGFVVRVGCKLFVCEEWAKMAKQLAAYFAGNETDFIKAQKDKVSQAQEVATPQPCDPTTSANLGETVARG